MANESKKMTANDIMDRYERALSLGGEAEDRELDRLMHDIPCRFTEYGPGGGGPVDKRKTILAAYRDRREAEKLELDAAAHKRAGRLYLCAVISVLAAVASALAAIYAAFIKTSSGP